MADTKSTTQQSNQTIRQEEAKAEVGSPPRQDERDKLDHERHEKGAIGGQQPSGQASQTGEAGRARDELSQNQKKPETSGQQR